MYRKLINTRGKPIGRFIKENELTWKRENKDISVSSYCSFTFFNGKYICANVVEDTYRMRRDKPVMPLSTTSPLIERIHEDIRVYFFHIVGPLFFIKVGYNREFADLLKEDESDGE